MEFIRLTFWIFKSSPKIPLETYQLFGNTAHRSDGKFHAKLPLQCASSQLRSESDGESSFLRSHTYIWPCIHVRTFHAFSLEINDINIIANIKDFNTFKFILLLKLDAIPHLFLATNTRCIFYMHWRNTPAKSEQRFSLKNIICLILNFTLTINGFFTQ